jgi:molybdopterin converting factor small subunit
MIHVTLKLLGPFRSLVAGADSDGGKIFAFEPGTLLSEALLNVSLPEDVPRVVLLNGVQQGDDPPLDDGDVITIFPPIAGGCSGISMRELSAGTGIYTVSASLQQLGPDVLISVWGGARPHIGALSISMPHPECAPEESRSSTVLQFSFPGHRDDVVARRVSERVASALQRRIVVSAGIHVPDITPAGIDTVLANVDYLIEKIISLLPDRAPKA